MSSAPILDNKEPRALSVFEPTANYPCRGGRDDRNQPADVAF